MKDLVKVYISKDEPNLVVHNAQIVKKLRSFYCTLEPYLITIWECIGNHLQYETFPDNIFTNGRYPLCIEIGDTADSVQVTLMGNRIDWLKNIEIHLCADSKDRIRFVSHVPVQQDIVNKLVALGVEIDMPGVSQGPN